MTPHYTLTPVRGYGPNQKCVQLAFLPAMPVAERNRLAGLAQGLGGASTSEPTGYLLTRGRTAKCQLLFDAGFHYQPTRMNHFFVSPSGQKLPRHTAVTRAQAILA